MTHWVCRVRRKGSRWTDVHLKDASCDTIYKTNLSTLWHLWSSLAMISQHNYLEASLVAPNPDNMPLLLYDRLGISPVDCLLPFANNLVVDIASCCEVRSGL